MKFYSKTNMNNQETYDSAVVVNANLQILNNLKTIIKIYNKLTTEEKLELKEVRIIIK